MVVHAERPKPVEPPAVHVVGVFFLDDRAERKIHQRRRRGSHKRAGRPQDVLHFMVANRVGVEAAEVPLSRRRIEVGERKDRHPDFIAGIARMANVETGRRVPRVPPHAGRHRLLDQRQPLEEEFHDCCVERQ
jgi:hypothetical protein